MTVTKMTEIKMTKTKIAVAKMIKTKTTKTIMTKKTTTQPITAPIATFNLNIHNRAFNWSLVKPRKLFLANGRFLANRLPWRTKVMGKVMGLVFWLGVGLISPNALANVGTKEHYDAWVANHPNERGAINAYKQYLSEHLDDVPPMHELLTTARSWQQCGFEPYQVPPPSLWANIVPTLTLYHYLIDEGVLPKGSKIRSVYRDPKLNDCAGGAKASKHLSNAAIDIWVPDHKAVKQDLCQFWQNNGRAYRFGLGLYGTGAIHLDTQGYRKWGQPCS